MNIYNPLDSPQQFYPTYQFDKDARDILLLEFEEAQKIANGQTQVLGQVTSVLLAAATAVIAGFGLAKDPNAVSKELSRHLLVVALVVTVAGWYLLRYFVDLQKQITINARKVVTLRLMLGVNYGVIQLTLPNWRVEGAINPFAIKYFSGWFSFRTVPFYLFTGSALLFCHLATKEWAGGMSLWNHSLVFPFRWLGFVTIISAYWYCFRYKLYDTHESIWLNVTQIVAMLLGIRLVDSVEYTLYRAKLNVIELERLKVGYSEVVKAAVAVEDSSFYRHGGIRLKALMRGLISQHARLRGNYNRSGGSTITMQLVRSLFIQSGQNKWRRKIVEIFLALWIESHFSKKQLVEMYVSVVRYSRGRFGLVDGIKYYLGDVRNRVISPAEAFFLIERLSNRSETFKETRVKHLMKKCLPQLTEEDVLAIYRSQVEQGRIKAS